MALSQPTVAIIPVTAKDETVVKLRNTHRPCVSEDEMIEIYVSFAGGVTIVRWCHASHCLAPRWSSAHCIYLSNTEPDGHIWTEFIQLC